MVSHKSKPDNKQTVAKPASCDVPAVVVQPKLAIGSANDPLEHEADAMADRVMRIPEMPAVQRKCAECEREEEQIKRKPSASQVTPFIRVKGENTLTASDAVTNKTISSKGSGSPMPEQTKSFMESRFGTDFSHVRIHTGADAAQLSDQLNAQAFTAGNNIYFNKGKYAPDSYSGKSLLAHELTHTMQQSGGAGQKLQKREMQFNPSLIAVQLRNAMQGLGTDEDAIYAALAGRTNDEVNSIASAYRTLTHRELQADLQDELTSGELLTLAHYSQILSDSPEHRALAVATQLKNAMEGWGTDENAIYVALQGGSTSDLNLIKTAYLNLTHRTLMSDLRDELTDEEYNIALGTMGESPNVTVRDTELGMLSMGNFDFVLNNCNIQIEVRVKFQFTSDIPDAGRNIFKPRFINAVHSKWQHSGYKLTGGISCPCEQIPITVSVVESNSNYHKIVDVENRTDTERRPFVASDINVNLHTDDDTLKHEFGHVLGLYDEYDGGFFENLMFWHQNRPDDPGSLMNGLNPDGTGNAEAGLRPRFFEHYRREANQTAPMNCNYIVTT